MPMHKKYKKVAIAGLIGFGISTVTYVSLILTKTILQSASLSESLLIGAGVSITSSIASACVQGVRQYCQTKSELETSLLDHSISQDIQDSQFLASLQTSNSFTSSHHDINNLTQSGNDQSILVVDEFMFNHTLECEALCKLYSENYLDPKFNMTLYAKKAKDLQKKWQEHYPEYIEQAKSQADKKFLDKLYLEKLQEYGYKRNKTPLEVVSQTRIVQPTAVSSFELTPVRVKFKTSARDLHSLIKPQTRSPVKNTPISQSNEIKTNSVK
jgi:hypothetical protein